MMSVRLGSPLKYKKYIDVFRIQIYTHVSHADYIAETDYISYRNIRNMQVMFLMQMIFLTQISHRNVMPARLGSPLYRVSFIDCP